MMIHAPFSDDVVVRLNGYQKFALAHPYTCPKCKSNLVAYHDGLRCDFAYEDVMSYRPCGYTQDWALDPPTEDDLKYMEIEFNAWKESKDATS